jgi:hypothetical protein
MAHESAYQRYIREDLKALGLGDRIDPRHIEAFMRLEHSTLDGLSPAQFRAEVKLSADCVIIGGRAGAEECARSFGL